MLVFDGKSKGRLSGKEVEGLYESYWLEVDVHRSILFGCCRCGQAGWLVRFEHARSSVTTYHVQS